MAKQHKDVDFVVETNDKESYFKSWEDAVGFAGGLSVSHGETVELDVLVYSKAGAKWWAGDDGVSQYEDDPDASVFERFKVKVTSEGRVP